MISKKLPKPKRRSRCKSDGKKLRHVIRLNPTVKQRIALARGAGCHRFAYNWALQTWQKWYKRFLAWQKKYKIWRKNRHGKKPVKPLKPNASRLRAHFNSIKKKKFPWIFESPKDANQEAFADLGTAFGRFFKGLKGQGPKAGYPKFKTKGKRDGFYVSNDKFHFDLKKDEKGKGGYKKCGHAVVLPVIGRVKVRELPRFIGVRENEEITGGRIVSARVMRRADHWYISICVDVGSPRRKQVEEPREIVGLDRGIHVAAVTSAGEFFHAPKPLKNNLSKLARRMRKLSRREKGSKNRAKARHAVARLHERIANIRTDWTHKVTTRLCRENAVIVQEDLNVAGMMKNRCLARALSDVGIGRFGSYVDYKSTIFGARVITADRWFPSTKFCRCGNIKENMPLNERTYDCEVCGIVEDRDLHAALNLEIYPTLDRSEWKVKSKKSNAEKRTRGSRGTRRRKPPDAHGDSTSTSPPKRRGKLDRKRSKGRRSGK